MWRKVRNLRMTGQAMVLNFLRGFFSRTGHVEKYGDSSPDGASRRAGHGMSARLHRPAAGRTRRDRTDGRRIRRADLSRPRYVFRIEPLEPRWADGRRHGGHESCGLAALSEYDLRRGRAARAVRRWRANAALEREGTASGRTRRRRHFRGRTLQADWQRLP